MTDLIVEENTRGRWIVKSAFNDAVLARRDTREKATTVAREMVWRNNQTATTDSKVIVHLGPKEPGVRDNE